MSLVQFVTSGSIQVSNPRTVTPGVSGVVHLLNPEINTMVGRFDTNSSGVGTYLLTDAHVSKDEYLTIPSAFGWVGEGTTHSGFSPTIPVRDDGYQEYSTNVLASGTVVINSRDFEDLSVSGFTVVTSGTGISQSGVVNSSGTMVGNGYLGFAASSSSYQAYLPTVPASSGINCGRAIYLVRGPTNQSANSTAAFAFLRQTSDIFSNCYKVNFDAGNGGNTTVYTISLTVGSLANPSSATIAAGTNSATILHSSILQYTSNTTRNANRLVWMMVEWEATSIGVYINLYFKTYSAGDTIDSVKSSATLISQDVYTGLTSGASFFTSTSETVAFAMGSDNTSTGQMGLDMLHLESLPSITKKGLPGLNLVEKSGVFAGSTTTARRRPYTSLFLGSTFFGTGIEGYHTFAIVNPIVSAADGYQGKAGAGYLVRSNVLGGTNGDTSVAIYEFTDPLASGINMGAARFCVRAGAVTFGTGPKLGFTFLRQSASVSGNAYTVEFGQNGINGADDYRFTIRKGLLYGNGSTPSYGDSDSFIGTSIASMGSAIPSLIRGDTLWFEVRWKLLGTVATIEILQAEADATLVTTDTSPGNVDYKMTSILTVTDVGTTYSGTTQAPLLTLRGANNVMDVFKVELRRSKLGN